VSNFVPGQRWVNYAELQMGLGTVLTVELRTVTLVFMATGETRTYSKQTAPLTRVIFSAGDTVRSHEGWSLKVEQVDEQDGLLTYSGNSEDQQHTELPEGQLDSHLKLNRPAERLFTGQVDNDRWFELRYQTLQQVNRLAHSDLRGLTGGRAALIPHQLYIAHEVASRYAPRVLLADEVGLGKTIEAGLILHQQLLTERAKRILIVVPETLLHQWLVEMLRRFNLAFSVFDEERCLGITESTGQLNPFHAEQQVLCTLEFLAEHPERHQQAVTGDWDLLVVDEAHHLQWSPAQASPEYLLIEALARETRGVLLLTATPEQLGKESHFARLRLLDPDRFHDFDSFLEEEKSYEPVAAAVELLLEEQPLTGEDSKQLLALLDTSEESRLLSALQNPGTDSSEKSAARTQLAEQLLDRHGTGRVLFRNTRTAVKGFPDRQLHSHPLPLPDAYAEMLEHAQAGTATESRMLLCPELLYQSATAAAERHWTKFDPRVPWLVDQLRELRPAKVLVITASAETAMDLAEWMHSRQGIHAAVFHEGLSIIERDRSAAYFADREYGTQVLICSEIGSEGRNFQFAHHLILFDLPLNPDLLEQRIGRLDRIGQTETIRIHVPWLQHSAQAVMQQWYQQGLGAFEHICPAGQTVYTAVETQLLKAIRAPQHTAALVETSRELNQSLNDALHRGRDRLLEYSSCRPAAARKLKERAQQIDQDQHLFNYLEQVCDCYDIDMEPHSTGSYILQPGEHMHMGSFPGLRDEGMTFTCERDIALANEDQEFISWEHPLLTGAIDMVLSNETGNCAMSTIRNAAVKPGTLLLECLYILDSVSSDVLQTSRYLPTGTIRIVTDQHGKDLGDSLSHELISSLRETIKSDTAVRIIRGYTDLLRDMIDTSEALANKQTPVLLAVARKQAQQMLGREIERLAALAQVNPNVRAEETGFLELQQEAVMTALDSATLRLEALRVLVAT
jgi:ATP-dependent helicase HepA